VFDEFVKEAEWWKELQAVAKSKISVRPDAGAKDQGEARKKTDEQMTKLLWTLMTSFDVNELQLEHSRAVN